jgi:hypothetical protein
VEGPKREAPLELHPLRPMVVAEVGVQKAHYLLVLVGKVRLQA